MDGNGRWAQQRGLPRPVGHREALKNIFPILDACAEMGVQAVTLYGFSTENWRRPMEEVDAFLCLVEQKIPWFANEVHVRGYRLRHSGSSDRLSEGMLVAIRNGVELSKNNTGMVVNVAFNYGGRDDIVRATRKIVGKGLGVEEIDEREFESFLDTAGLPDIDLVIRTGGEHRLSNFCLWQSANAVFYSTEVLWPDLEIDQFHQALQCFASQKNG
jgi:undecaprenyl diphosphate synthase